MTNVIPFRNRELFFELTAEELAFAEALAAQAGLSFENYARQLILQQLLPSERTNEDGTPEEE